MEGLQKLDSSWSLIEGDGIDILETTDDILKGADPVEEAPVDDEEEDDDVLTNTRKLDSSIVTSNPEFEEGDDSTFRILARDFTERGIADFPDDWSGDEDEFRAIIAESAKDKVLEQYQLHNPVVSGFLQYVSAGGKPEKFIETLNGPTFDENNDRDVYTLYLKSTTKFNDDKIEKLVDRVEALEELEEEAEAAREWFKENKSQQIKSITEQQEREAELRKQQEQIDLQERRRLISTAKQLNGVPIDNNKAFEKFYFDATDTFRYEDTTYKVTPYQKRLLERNASDAARREHELLLAYLEFSNYTIKDVQKQQRQAATSTLKQSLEKTIQPKRIVKLVN